MRRLGKVVVTQLGTRAIRELPCFGRREEGDNRRLWPRPKGRRAVVERQRWWRGWEQRYQRSSRRRGRAAALRRKGRRAAVEKEAAVVARVGGDVRRWPLADKRGDGGRWPESNSSGWAGRKQGTQGWLRLFLPLLFFFFFERDGAVRRSSGGRRSLAKDKQ